MALLDFFLSLQDRRGNIDYVEHWYWVENGSLKSRKAVAHGDETEPLPGRAMRIKRTITPCPAPGFDTEMDEYPLPPTVWSGLFRLTRQIVRPK